VTGRQRGEGIYVNARALSPVSSLGPVFPPQVNLSLTLMGD